MMGRGFSRSLTEFRRHPWIHLLSTTTIGIALSIIGVFFLGYESFKTLAEGDVARATGTLFLKDALPQNQKEEIRKQIEAFEIVDRVEFKSEKSTLGELANFMGRDSMDFLPEGTVFPDIFEIRLKKGATENQILTLETILTNFSGIAEVDFSQDWLVQFREVKDLLGIVGFFIVLGVLIGCAFIIANFMGIRLQSKKREVDVIRLMGASKRFIVMPFVWEGFLEGILGSLLALGFLFLLRTGLVNLLSTSWIESGTFSAGLFLNWTQMLLLVCIGVTMALLGSATVFFRIQDPK